MSIVSAAGPTRGASESFNVAVHGLRAFATIMVFCAHMLDSFNTYFFPDYGPLVAAMPYVKRFGTFGVEMFFVISGYVIMNSVTKYDLREFLLRRIMRIYPLFVFFTLLFFALNWASHAFPERLSFVGLLLNLSFLDIYFGVPALSPNAWSLTFEANFYLFAGPSCFFLRGRMRIALALMSLVALAFVVAFPVAAYFVVGCILYFVRHRQPAETSWVAQSGAALLLGILAATVGRHEPLDVQVAVANTVLLLATALFFFVVTTRHGLFAHLATIRPLSFMATISYSFYLAHPYSYFALRVLFQRLGLESLGIGAAAAIYFPAMTVLAVAVSYVVHRLLEIAPYRAVFGESVFKMWSAAAEPIRDGGTGQRTADVTVPAPVRSVQRAG